jgi:hypothetical protein
MAKFWVDDEIVRHISAGKLKELLAGVPDDCRLVANRVGNLAIYRGSVEEQEMCDGAIEFSPETIEWYTDENGEPLPEPGGDSDG